MRNTGYASQLTTIKNGVGCFTVKWSPYILMDKYLIHKIVPSEKGIYQVFRKQGKSLQLLMMDKAFYGGLRNRLREIIDPLYMGYNPYREEIQESICYLRFTLVSLQDDMDDLLHFFTGHEETGRYEDILVEEKETMEVRKQ